MKTITVTVAEGKKVANGLADNLKISVVTADKRLFNATRNCKCIRIHR